MPTSRVADVLGLTPSEVNEVTSVLKGTLSSLKGAFTLDVTDAEWLNVIQIREAVAYQGFDPMKIIKEFHKRAEANPIGKGDKPMEVTVGENKFTIYEKCEPKTDLIFLITLFLTRGNNVAKILLKCDGNVKTTIERKCSQYGISTLSRAPGAVLGPNVMTLARIAQAFSPAAATVILGHSMVGNLKSKLFSGISLPLLMTHTIFSGLLRQEDTALIEIAKFLNLEMTIMLSAPKEKRRMEGQTLGDLYERSELFVNAAVSGSIISDTVKQKILTKAAILTEDETLSVTAASMSSMCGMLNSYKGETYSTVTRKMAKQLKDMADAAAKASEERTPKE